VAVRAIGSPLRDLKDAIAADSPNALTLKLTLVLVLLHGASSGAAQIPVRVLCGTLLLFPTLVRRQFFWWPLLAALVAANAQAWYVIDNHKYLISYWTLACVLSLGVKESAAFLQVTARVLIALVFGFATFWKAFGGEYFDGSFMYWTFLTDPRVSRVAALVAGYSEAEVSVAREALVTAANLHIVGVPMPVLSSNGLWLATLLLSWLGLLVEGAVAVTHAIPSRRLYHLRHATLMGFIAMTYFLLPVSGFAFVLAVVGFAQCRDDDQEMRWRYLALLAVVQLITIDWQQYLPLAQ
jgi:hypothetical protein